MPLNFHLAPGERDGWRFVSDRNTDGNIGPSFQYLRIKSEKCEREITLATLENRIQRNGAWVLLIDDGLFSCD